MEHELKCNTRYGIDLTRRCQMRCSICFYRFNTAFNTACDKTMETTILEINDAVVRGCEHIVVVGWGEPMLYPHIKETIEYCKGIGVSSSIITNGNASVDRYDELYKAGLDHVHISTHGLRDMLPKIFERDESVYDRQLALKEYLKANSLPWRSNTTIQLLNYKQLEAIAEENLEYGCRHVVLLNFLPHYEWGTAEKVRSVAVAPGELRPYVERAINITVSGGAYSTLRYFPMCHIDEKYWKYITNALYVLYDPWEWEYFNCGKKDEDVWKSAEGLATVGNKGVPCGECKAMIHCGGWNGAYMNSFENQSGCAAVSGVESEARGYYFMQNPANKVKGWFK